MRDDDSNAGHLRRGFLKTLGVAGASPFARGLAGGAGATALAGANAQSAAAAAVPALGYLSLSQDEAGFVEALVNLMCPADEFTPNGVDCGLAVYIDRQLAGEFGRGARRYQRGPWSPGLPQQGLQLPLTPEQFFKAGIDVAQRNCVARYGKPFDQLTPEQAAAFLDELAVGKVVDTQLPMSSWFNELFYPLFTQGCFADPIYGGNLGKVFWKMVGYPGLPATHTIDMVQFRGKPYPGAKDPKSIADFS